MKPFRRSLVGVLAVLLTTTSAWAQLSTAQLSGRIADESGAVLPGVTVTVTQTATGLTRSVTTDEKGTYVLPNLPTGPYRLEAALQGFRTYAQTGIVLQVAGTPTINVVLAIGTLDETVSVEAAAPLVDVKSAGISDVVDNEKIVELPLQGRQVTDLIVLAGAAVQTGVVGTRNFSGGVNISVAGGVPTGVGYLLDGATHNSPQSNVNLPMPFPDALQEFRVQTSGLSAQNGMHAAASVNAVTKSGTNNFHGNGFEFLRDHRLNSKSPFAAIGADGKRQDDGLRRNQFGGTIGGPIARDKLFFFGGYQGTRLRFRPSDQIAFVPTAAMLAGDFTAFASPACNNGRQVNLGGGFVGNRINPALFSPAGMNLARRLPTATDPCGQITYTTADDSNEGQGIGRIDYQLSQDHSVFGRYMATFVKKAPAYQGGSDNVIKAANSGINNLAHALTLGDTMVFGPTMVNAIRVAYNRTTVNRYNTTYFDPSDLGIKLYPYVRGQMAIQIPGAWEIPAGSTSAFFRNNFYQVADDLTLVRGSHQFGIGGNYAYWNGHYNSTSRAAGIWIFDGSASGLGLADLLLGRVTSVEHGGPQDVPIRSNYLGFYGQDTWRASDRVTLNLGLRWEPYFGVSVDNNAVYNFNIDNFRRGIKSTGVRERARRSPLSGRRRFPIRKDRPQQTVDELLAACRRRVGRDRRRAHGAARVVRVGLRLHVERLSPDQLLGAAVRQPLAHHRSAGTHGRPVRGRRGRSPPDCDQPRRDVPRVWLVRHHESRHQLATRAELERHLRAADRGELGRRGELYRQLLRPAVGADVHQPRHLHGAWTLHAGRRTDVSGLLDQRQPECPAGALPGESEGGRVDRHAGSERRHRLAGVSRAETIGAASIDWRPQPERQLHVVAVHGHENAEHVQPDRFRVHEPRRPRVR